MNPSAACSPHSINVLHTLRVVLHAATFDSDSHVVRFSTLVVSQFAACISRPQHAEHTTETRFTPSALQSDSRLCAHSAATLKELPERACDATLRRTPAATYTPCCCCCIQRTSLRNHTPNTAPYTCLLPHRALASLLEQPAYCQP